MSNKGYRSERLDFQFFFFLDPKKFKTAEDREEATKKARKHFLQTGKSIAGVRIVARWRNPDNKNPLHANWKTSDDPGQSLEGFYKTITKRVGR